MSTQATISTEQVDLLSVTGRLDDTGLTQLRMQLEALFDTGLAVTNALDEARPSEFLLVCQAGDWDAGRTDLDRGLG